MAASTCRYKAPLTCPDTLSVGSRVAAIGEDHLLMEQVAVSQKSGTVVAEGEVTVVSYDYGAGCRVSSPRLVRQGVGVQPGLEQSFQVDPGHTLSLLPCQRDEIVSPNIAVSVALRPPAQDAEEGFVTHAQP